MNLLSECRPFEEYPSGDIEQILLIHGHNMQDAGLCRARHNALVAFIKKKQAED